MRIQSYMYVSARRLAERWMIFPMMPISAHAHVSHIASKASRGDECVIRYNAVFELLHSCM